jgi:5-methylthioribose kinase
MIRRIVGLAKVKDITSIEDVEKRVRAERICLKIAKDCMINRESFLCGDDYLKALLKALKEI